MLVLSVNLKGVLAPRYKNVDFPSFPPWAAKNLAVMPGDPGYHTIRSVGLRHWVPTDVTGGVLPAIGDWVSVDKTPPGKLLLLGVGPTGAKLGDKPTHYGCPCGKLWAVVGLKNEWVSLLSLLFHYCDLSF